MDDHTMWNDGINRALKLFCDRVACPTDDATILICRNSKAKPTKSTHKRKRTK